VERFTATVRASGSRVYVSLPFDPDAVWGAKSTHHVNGTIGTRRFRGRVERIDSGPAISPGNAWCRDHPLIPGDEVEVTLAAEGPQRADLAPDITAALDANPAAAAFFDSLATFYRKGYLRWIDATTRRPDVRAARIAEMITLLTEGKKQRS